MFRSARLSWLLLAAIFAVNGSALAQPQEQRPAAALGSASVEPLTRSTFIATMDAEFRGIDANKDGILSRPELDQHQRRIAVTSAEQRARSTFAQLDRDGNRQISLDEFLRASTAQAAKTDAAGVLKRLDTNRDGKVTIVEHRTLTLTGFDRLDLDKDGVVNAAEQRAGGFVK